MPGNSKEDESVSNRDLKLSLIMARMNLMGSFTIDVFFSSDLNTTEHNNNLLQILIF